jgi:hypothetical protein
MKLRTAPLWKVLLLVIPFLGMLSIGLALFPKYSPQATVAAGVLSSAGIVASTLTVKLKNWWAQIAIVNVVLLFGLGIALRAGMDVFGEGPYWPLSLILLFLFAWAIPLVAPQFSARILREQLAPDTRVGRGCLTFSLALIPAVGAISYLVQRLASHRGLEKLDSFLIAVIASTVTIGAAQAFSHQYWAKKPWANQADISPQRHRA